MRIESERLILRPFAASDIDALAPMFADPEVMRFIGDGPATREETEGWLVHWMSVLETSGRAHLAATLRTTGQLIGRCGPVVRDLPEGREIEISYLLGREHWGRGYATEAAAAVRDHAFGVLGEHRLVALIATGNDASEAVARRVGMTLERDTEFHGRPCGMWVVERK